jgi:hypothetical protein
MGWEYNYFMCRWENKEIINKLYGWNSKQKKWNILLSSDFAKITDEVLAKRTKKNRKRLEKEIGIKEGR